MKCNATLLSSALALSLITFAPIANATNCIDGAAETPVCEGNWVYAIHKGSAISGTATEVYTDGTVRISHADHIIWVHVSKVSPNVGSLNGFQKHDCVHFRDRDNHDNTGTVNAVFANGIVEILSSYTIYFRESSSIGKKARCIR